jgi:hypothetical protein
MPAVDLAQQIEPEHIGVEFFRGVEVGDVER